MFLASSVECRGSEASSALAFASAQGEKGPMLFPSFLEAAWCKGVMKSPPKVEFMSAPFSNNNFTAPVLAPLATRARERERSAINVYKYKKKEGKSQGRSEKF